MSPGHWLKIHVITGHPRNISNPDVHCLYSVSTNTTMVIMLDLVRRIHIIVMQEIY